MDRDIGADHEHDESVPLTKAQRDELDRRLQHDAEHPSESEPFEEVIRRLRAKSNSAHP